LAGGIGVVVVLSVLGLGAAVGYEDLREKARHFVEGDGLYSLRSRELAARRGWEMAMDRPVLGWGAGCFQYGFTKYQRREPELMRVRQLALRWEHVHNDWLEFLIELGLLGSMPIVFTIGYSLYELLRLRAWKNFLALPVLSGFGALALHATIDFPLRNPAIASTACALVPLVLRWCELDKPKRHRAS
jgi:O-antigen ligase